MRALIVFLIALFSSLSASRHEVDANDPYMMYLIPKVIGYSHQEDFLKALEMANHQSHKLAPSSIEQLESRWEKEKSERRRPLHSKVSQSDISQYLIKVEEHNKGLFSDIVALDKKGLVVGMTAKSHKYNRFYEDKFSKPWNAGPNGVYISPYLFSPAVGKSLIYICITITNRSHESIGVLVVGVDKDIMEATLNSVVMN